MSALKVKGGGIVLDFCLFGNILVCTKSITHIFGIKSHKTTMRSIPKCRKNECLFTYSDNNYIGSRSNLPPSSLVSGLALGKNIKAKYLHTHSNNLGYITSFRN